MHIGVDIGGTFTDFVVFNGTLKTFKLPSTPEAPEQAVLTGLARLALDSDGTIVHGSTVATNAVLERRGARTAFIATQGFGDLLTIGRQNRTALYDLLADRPQPLIGRELSMEVDERVDWRGEVLTALDEGQLDGLVARLRELRVESVAVCLLFSFLHPNHERRLGDRLAAAGLPVSLSSEIVPEFREYERASTTALDAYVKPVVARYLGRLEHGLGTTRLRVMQSNGGSLSAAQTREQPVRAVLSGPAGGVVAAQHVAQLAGYPRILSLDMGGTSTDVSLVDECIRLTSEGQIDGLPLHVPLIDIHTVGSGGGSIAEVDRGGSLKVGPRSAGADPGPACYGRGGADATVTDANLVLGRLDPDRFLDGRLRLDARAAGDALRRLADQLGLGRSERAARRAARGVVEVANAHVARALRLVSVERGHDPRQFTLVSFGGAGGLHAAAVARTLGIPRVLIPVQASVLSALGMLIADISRDYVQTVMLPGETGLQELERRYGPLIERGQRELRTEGCDPAQVQLSQELDLRYRGQSYELRLPYAPGFVEAFHQLHQQLYGYSDPELPVEIVNLRLQARAAVDPPPLTAAESQGRGAPPAGQPGFGAAEQPLTGYDGPDLATGDRLEGPGLIFYPDTTVLLGPDDSAQVDRYGNLLLEVGKG